MGEQGRENGAFSGDDFGVVLVDHGSTRRESNDIVVEVAARLRKLMGVENIEPSHMELAEPTIADAFRKCVNRGARHVVVAPYFLGPGRHVEEDIPRLAAEAAANHPGVSFEVAGPLGLHPGIITVLQERIASSRAPGQASGGVCEKRGDTADC